MYMIIDKECLQTLLGTSVETLEQDTNNERYKTVLEAWPEIDQYDTFPGWMKCRSLLLWHLWLMMCDLDEMRMSWEKIDAEDDGNHAREHGNTSGLRALDQKGQD
ncbi:uncharacterized protein N7518_002539 [Penicillium psychrosexuale]|uniref:uncharacterized protein n=1 Tax=Penicillium psychrosexuale TaxID=1002107 RepID=UPI0025454A1A|nr:uncharacterized protein N7518_002539 [Penicillium psychrosexuale]KAJ5800471.1 hypothetical protein N7518_002539 [Penicillium psychrosexuale]